MGAGTPHTEDSYDDAGSGWRRKSGMRCGSQADAANVRFAMRRHLSAGLVRRLLKRDNSFAERSRDAAGKLSGDHHAEDQTS